MKHATTALCTFLFALAGAVFAAPPLTITLDPRPIRMWTPNSSGGVNGPKTNSPGTAPNTTNKPAEK